MYPRWDETKRAFLAFVEAAGPRQFARLAERAPPLRRFDDANALLAHLHGRWGSDAARDELVAELAVAARRADDVGQLALQVLWLALWPGLSLIARRAVSFSGEDPDEVCGELAEQFMLVVVRFDRDAVSRVAATLLMNTQRDLLKSLRRTTAVRCLEAPLEGLRESQRSGEDLLNGAIDVERLVGSDAAILACTFEGLTGKETAGRCGLPLEIVKKRLQRAAARIRGDFDDSDVPERTRIALMWGERSKRGGGAVAKGGNEPSDEMPVLGRHGKAMKIPGAARSS